VPRFVILRHDGPQGLHWDFMLETGSVLATWALAESPDSAHPIAARPLPEHRLAYLDYEGPVSGGRGTVTRWDEGTYRIEREAEGLLVAVLWGKRLSGRASLTRTAEAAEAWRFAFEAHQPGMSNVESQMTKE
jgi:hypothetical protein